jgi:murein L,D-transpeptidase YcbB/YkuD
MTEIARLSRRHLISAIAGGAFAGLLPAGGAGAGTTVTGFRQGVAEAAARDEALAAFYRARDFEGIWSGGEAVGIARRNAFLSALTEAPLHALPAGRHDPRWLIAMLQKAATPFEQGRAEVELSRHFLRFAVDMKSGMLVPREANRHIFRDRPEHDRLDLMKGFAAAEPVAFLRDLAPRSPEYARLVRERLRLEAIHAQGGWGPEVDAVVLSPGMEGGQVVALRNRLIAMGWLAPTATRSYDQAMGAAVERFQAVHGLAPDGIAGEAVLAEMNVDVKLRLRSVIVAMERERWNNAPRGERHIWVNLCDFSACIVDEDRVTFRTRAVVGAMDEERQTPEFELVCAPVDHRAGVSADAAAQPQRGRTPEGHRQFRAGAEPGFGQLRPLQRAQLSFCDASATVGVECAGGGQVPVPEPLRHLSARFARQGAFCP